MEKSCAVGAAHLTCSSFADSTPPPQEFYCLSLIFYRLSFAAFPAHFKGVLQ